MTLRRHGTCNDPRRRIMIRAMLVCVVFFGSGGTRAHASAPSVHGSAQSLRLNTDEGARDALREAEQERAEIIALLRERIERPDIPANRVQIASAIKIAGAVRAGELADALIGKLEFRADGPLLPFGVPRPEDYPAVQALRGIGRPSMEPLLRQLRRTHVDMERLLIHWALSGIEEPRFLKQRLQGLLDAEPADRETTAKANLRDAISMIHIRP